MKYCLICGEGKNRKRICPSCDSILNKKGIIKITEDSMEKTFYFKETKEGKMLIQDFKCK